MVAPVLSNTHHPEAKAKILFASGDLLFEPDPASGPSFSVFILQLHDGAPADQACVTLQEIIDPFSLHIIFCDHDCLPTTRMKHKVFWGSPPGEAPLAAHRLEGSVVIRSVEELLSADNPAEIAHGFPVPKVENKQTEGECLMK